MKRFFRFLNRMLWRYEEEAYAIRGDYRSALYALHRGEELRSK